MGRRRWPFFWRAREAIVPPQRPTREPRLSGGIVVTFRCVCFEPEPVDAAAKTGIAQPQLPAVLLRTIGIPVRDVDAADRPVLARAGSDQLTAGYRHRDRPTVWAGAGALTVLRSDRRPRSQARILDRGPGRYDGPVLHPGSAHPQRLHSALARLPSCPLAWDRLSPGDAYSPGIRGRDGEPRGVAGGGCPQPVGLQQRPHHRAGHCRRGDRYLGSGLVLPGQRVQLHGGPDGAGTDGCPQTTPSQAGEQSVNSAPAGRRPALLGSKPPPGPAADSTRLRRHLRLQLRRDPATPGALRTRRGIGWLRGNERGNGGGVPGWGAGGSLAGNHYAQHLHPRCPRTWCPATVRCPGTLVCANPGSTDSP